MKIGITTFGGDGGKSGISRYIINILREFSVFEHKLDLEVIVYEDEKELFVPNPDGISTICYGDALRSPVVNIAWHQFLLPELCRKQKIRCAFSPRRKQAITRLAAMPVGRHCPRLFQHPRCG